MAKMAMSPPPKYVYVFTKMTLKYTYNEVTVSNTIQCIMNLHLNTAEVRSFNLLYRVVSKRSTPSHIC